jgi:hypothetical protein
MKPSPAQHEGPGKAEESQTSPGSLARFKKLAAKLVAVDPIRFRETLAKDEEKRREKKRGK